VTTRREAEDLVVLVTGGNRGIGFEIARQLAIGGARVVLGSRDEESAQSAVASLSLMGLRADAVSLDVTHFDSSECALRATLTRYGRVDVLVNNAGIAIDGPSHRASAPRFDLLRRTLDTNLLGAWNMCALVVPHMREAGYGRIVNVSSTMGSLSHAHDARSPAYRVSKAGLNMLTRALACELEGTGILVNAASPGYTRTDMSPGAVRPVEEGADTPVWLATLPADGPTGGFFFDRAPMAW
jgi:NAD(P)-dependent dehydrogenase (short-subunit alcohol dehydrogenase family)